MTDLVMPAYFKPLMAGKPIMVQAYDPKTGEAITLMTPLNLEPRIYAKPGVDVYASLRAIDSWRGPDGVHWKWFDGEVEVANGQTSEPVTISFLGSLHLSWNLEGEEWMPLYVRLLNDKYGTSVDRASGSQ